MPLADPGRPRGVYSAGAEEPCAFVGVDAPFVDPIVAATTVDLVDGLVAHGVPGVGRLPAEGAAATRSDHRHAHVETLVIGASAEGVTEANAAAARGDRVDAGRVARSAGRQRSRPTSTCCARATALGVYDDGYVVIHERSRPVERVWHVRAGNVVRRDRRARTADRVRRQRPARRDAGLVRPRLFLDRFGVLPGERAVVFTTNHARSRRRVRAGGRGRRDRRDRRRRRRRRRGDRRRAARASTSANGWAVAGTDGDPRVSAVHLRRVPAASATPSTPTCCSCPAVGTRSSSSGAAIGGGLRYDEPRACFVPDGDRTPLALGRGRGRRRGPHVATRTGSCRPRTTHGTTWTCSATQTVADVLDAVAARPPLGRAHQAGRRTSAPRSTRDGRRAC